MSRRRANVDLGAVVAAVAAGAPAADEAATRILDAAESLLRTSGLRRWAVDDVAERAGVARSTIYRLFGGRDDLVHAVLARELRRVLAAIGAAVDAEVGLEDQAVAAVTVAIGALDDSVVDALLRLDAPTFLPFLTIDAGPLVALARDAIAAKVVAEYGVRPDPAAAEVCARLGLSFVLTRDTVLPVDDPEALAAAVRRSLRPLVQALGSSSARV